MEEYIKEMIDKATPEDFKDISDWIDTEILKDVKNMKDKTRMLNVCCGLEDLIVIAATKGHDNVDEIRNTLEYFMEVSEITSEELSEYQISKQNK